MSEDFDLSILIPTRNRGIYLVKTLTQIVTFLGNKVEIVVQDNSDTDELASTIKESFQQNVKYHYCPGNLSFVENFNKAIENASGKYLCLIGDDDGVLPNVLDYVEYCINNHIEVMVPEINFEYFYPYSVPIKKLSEGAIRYLRKKPKIHKVNIEKELIRLLKNGGINYTGYRLGKLYHGIVLKDLLTRIREKQEYFVGGLTPDIYLAASLSINCKFAYYVTEPLTIAGVCPLSGSSQSSRGVHVGNYDDAPHLKGHDGYEWSKEVPKFYSVETIWSDSLLAAIRDNGRDDLLKLYSSTKLVSYCYFHYKSYRNECNKVLFDIRSRLTVVQYIRHIIEFIFFPLIVMIQRGHRRIRRLFCKLIIENGISDITMATYKYNVIKKSNFFMKGD